MADIDKITVPSTGVTYDIKDSTARASIPTKTSQLNNDSGFINASQAPVTSVNSKTGAVSLTASDVSAIPTSSFASANSTTNSDFANKGTAYAYVPDMRFIAFWNGAYDSAGASNLSRCSSGAILGTNTVKDYITDKGTNGSWYYEKFASGKIEAIFQGSVTYGTMSASGQLYRSTNNAVAIPSGIFATTPQRTEITVNNASTVVVCATAVASSTTNVNVQVWRSTNASSSIDCTIRCMYTP